MGGSWVGPALQTQADRQNGGKPATQAAAAPAAADLDAERKRLARRNAVRGARPLADPSVLGGGDSLGP
jgi:hypothetical protein